MLSDMQTMEASLLENHKNDKNSIVSTLTDFTVHCGNTVSEAYKEILPHFFTTFRDGYVISNQDGVSVSIRRMFYPQWWLQLVGFFNIPGNKNGILFTPSPVDNNMMLMSSVMMMIVVVLFGMIGCFVVGWHVGKCYTQNTTPSHPNSSTSGNGVRYQTLPTMDDSINTMEMVGSGGGGYQVVHDDNTASDMMMKKTTSSGSGGGKKSKDSSKKSHRSHSNASGVSGGSGSYRNYSDIFQQDESNQV